MHFTLKLFAIIVAILVAANSLVAGLVAVNWKNYRKLSANQKWRFISPKLTALAPTVLGSIALIALLSMM